MTLTGSEPVSASALVDSELEQSHQTGGADSGAVTAEDVMRLVAKLSPAERTRLTDMILWDHVEVK
jgi:hypothetical protein